MLEYEYVCVIRARFCIMRARSKSLTRNTISLHDCGAYSTHPYRTRECYMYNNRQTSISHNGKYRLRVNVTVLYMMQAANLRVTALRVTFNNRQ